jgi:hypothetical protein
MGKMTKWVKDRESGFFNQRGYIQNTSCMNEVDEVTGLK